MQLAEADLFDDRRRIETNSALTNSCTPPGN
jgi:hypothetical protein